jgi:protein-ribulosamine 3-kinase
MFDESTRERRKEGKKFGYHTTTHNGRLTQENTWTGTSEEYFVRGLRRMLEHDEMEDRARSEGMKNLLPPLFEKVIPRLLGTMESGEREPRPVFCHGDFKMGNVGVREGERGGAGV